MLSPGFGAPLIPFKGGFGPGGWFGWSRMVASLLEVEGTVTGYQWQERGQAKKLLSQAIAPEGFAGHTFKTQQTFCCRWLSSFSGLRSPVGLPLVLGCL